MNQYNPLDRLSKNTKKDPEKKTKVRQKEIEGTQLSTVRTYKHLKKEIQQLILDYEEYKSITDFVSLAIEEKLEKERKKHN